MSVTDKRGDPMKKLILIAAVSLLAMGGAQAAAKFEGATVPGTAKSNAAFFRIEVATGKVVQVWGSGTQFAPVVDSGPIPAGDYHLYPTSTPAIDGSVVWTMERMDSNSGRSWVATGGGNVPLTWNEITNPK
jgi:hypothetical protein